MILTSRSNAGTNLRHFLPRVTLCLTVTASFFGRSIPCSVQRIFTLSITNPFWVAKTRMCLQYDKFSVTTPQTTYRGMFDCLLKTYRYEGIAGLYRGYLPGIVGVSHGALQFMAYEELKKMYNQYKDRPIDYKLTSIEYLVFAAISKIFAASATYPYQVVRSRLQEQHRAYGGAMDVIRTTWRFEGMRGLYKGITPYLLHVVPAIAIVFCVFEEVSLFLDSMLKPRHFDTEINYTTRTKLLENESQTFDHKLHKDSSS